MPSRRGLRQIVGIPPHAELIVMVSLGMVRNAMDWFSFTWNGNVQEIWNLPGPEPSFTAKYHFDYWVKNVLSLVVLFRNFTTHLHLLFYVLMLYPLLTGERPRLILPWLYLQMLKNIVTDIICTAAGVLLCWILHSCGSLALEFLLVRIISMMPSIYLWRRIRSHYFDLYYAELDREFVLPATKPSQGLTLAQRRRATKSLDGALSVSTSSEDRSRINSCLTYEEFFGPANWEADLDDKLSKSLTTLLTVESRESDDAGEGSCLTIIDDENLTPAEKTLKILGLTREEVDATVEKIQNKTSTYDLGESGTGSLETRVDADMESPSFSVTGETVRPRAVGIQVRFTNEPEANDKKCECCRGTKCSRENDTDSDEEEARAIGKTKNAEDRFSGGMPTDCCDRDREAKGSGEIRRGSEETHCVLADADSKASSSSMCNKNDSDPGSCLRTVVEGDGIAWENLKEINFVSVIDKALRNEVRPFEPEKESESTGKIVSPDFRRSCKKGGDRSGRQGERNHEEVIPEREDGTKFIHITRDSEDPDPVAFPCPTSASFGIDSDILAQNASCVFENYTASGTQSFDSTTAPAEQLTRPDHDTEINSYFRSSFQRHSDMFDDTRAQLEPVPRRVHSSDYRVAHNGANEDSRFCQTDVNSFDEKIDGDFYSLGLHGSSSTLRYRRDGYDAWDFDRRNMEDLGNQRIMTGSKVHCPSLQTADKALLSSGTSLTKEDNGSVIHAWKTPSLIFGKPFEGDESNSNSEAPVRSEEQNGATRLVAVYQSVTGGESSCSKSGCREISKDRRSLASSSRASRSSKADETPGERETKEMEALKAYNEKTLFKYKREMDACRVREKVRDGCQDPVRRKSPVGTSGNGFNQAFYVPSVPELEKPGKELILNIERAYARFTRSKPVDSVNGEALRGTCAAKDFLDIYTGGGGGPKKDSRKIKVGDKTGTRKRHSKYSKLTEVINEADVTSGSCKLIEGSQKGRELGRTTARKNIRSQNVEVYFLERQIDDKPTTSKNHQLTTIKSFSRKDGADPFPTASSEILTSEGTRSPIVDSEYQGRLRNENAIRNVKDAVKNIDWSFHRSNNIRGDSHEVKDAGNSRTGIVSEDTISGRENIVHKTTENILQSVFSNGENSERGFSLGEYGNEVYPIFQTVVTAMEEIARAAALRGYSDEFISQPATEIEIPKIDSGNLYGSINLPSELGRGSSSGFFRCCILPEDSGAAKRRSGNEESLAIETFVAPNFGGKKLEANPPDRDETGSIEDERASSLLNKLISSVEPGSAEINVPVLGPEDLPEEPTDTGGDPPSPELRELEDYSPFFVEGFLTPEKSPASSRGKNPEDSLENGAKSRISSEEVRLALQNVILEPPGRKIRDSDGSQFEFDVASCRSILDHFKAGGNELRSIVFEFFDQFSNCPGHRFLPRNFRGSEFVAGLGMLTDLSALESKAGEILNASEETASGGSGNSSFERNDQSERAATEAGSSGTRNFENVGANTSAGSRDTWRKKDRGREEDDSDRRRDDEIDNDPDSRASSSEKIDESDDGRRGLLANISEPESAPLAHSEMINRANFRREVISFAFAQAIKQGASSSDLTKENEPEMLPPNIEDSKAEKGFLTPSHGGLNGLETGAEMPGLWTTDDDGGTASLSALTRRRKDAFSIEDDDATPDIVLRDIETAERAIGRMRTVFEEFLSGGKGGQERGRRGEATPEAEDNASSSTKWRFPVNDELLKLQKLVKTVANYVTITAGCSSQSIESYNEVVGSDIRGKELASGCSGRGSDDLEEVTEIMTKNGGRSGPDDSQVVEVPAVPGKEVDCFSSWDKVIPLSTRRQIAKMKRRGKPKKAAGGEPSRRVLRVMKLIDNKNADFFSARSVPQRGRGLSSGYLMDSDSDGNFTVSRPPSPVSVESETSRSYSWDNGQPDVSPNPLTAAEIFPVSETSQSRDSRPVESCGSSSSANPIKDAFIGEISASSMSNEAETSFPRKPVSPVIIGGDLNTRNASRDGELRVLGAESISIGSDLQCTVSVDAAGIENELKDVLEKILSHQFSGVDPLKNGFRIGSKNASLNSISVAPKIESSLNSQSDNSTREYGVQGPEQIVEDCREGLQKFLSKAEDASAERLSVCFKGPDSASRNSDAVSFEVSPRKSGVSVKHVAIGTEYDVEAFKDLLDTFEKIRSIGRRAAGEQASPNCEDEGDDSLVNREDERSSDEKLTKISERTRENYDAPGPATISFDSFDSWTSQDTIKIAEPSARAMSISDHTHFEDFPEQVDSRLRFSQASLVNFDGNRDRVAAASPGGSVSDDGLEKEERMDS